MEPISTATAAEDSKACGRQLEAGWILTHLPTQMPNWLLDFNSLLLALLLHMALFFRHEKGICNSHGLTTHWFMPDILDAVKS